MAELKHRETALQQVEHLFADLILPLQMEQTLQVTEEQQAVLPIPETPAVQLAEVLHHRRTDRFIPVPAVQPAHRVGLPIPEVLHAAQAVHHPLTAGHPQAVIQALPTAGPVVVHPEDQDLQHTAGQVAAVALHTAVPAVHPPVVHTADQVLDIVEVAAVVIHLPVIPADHPQAPVLHQVAVHIPQVEEGKQYFSRTI